MNRTERLYRRWKMRLWEGVMIKLCFPRQTNLLSPEEVFRYKSARPEPRNFPDRVNGYTQACALWQRYQRLATMPEPIPDDPITKEPQ